MAGYDYGGSPGSDWGHARPSGDDVPYRADPEGANLTAPTGRYNGGHGSHGSHGGRPPVSPALSAGDTDPESRRSEERNRSKPRGSRSASGQVRTCKKCVEPLTGQFVRALDGTFHLDCFRCRVSAQHDAEAQDLSTLFADCCAGLRPDRGIQVLPGRR